MRKLNWKKRLFVGVAGGLMALAAGAPALAQDSVTEVLVVAQRRAENIQDVPISVTPLSGARLDAAFAGGADILALSAAVPGLNVESSNGRAAPRFYIRGLGNTDFDLAASQPVSVIMDDVVMENVALKSFPLFDIQQVEVYRGPQGTLFGRNTTAGIVNIISARPTAAPEAYGELTYGTYNTATFEGAVSGPLAGDMLTARASLMAKHRDNWIDNDYTGAGDYKRDLGGYDDYAGRLQFLYQPTADFSALLNLHGRKLDGQSASAFRANLFATGSNEIAPSFDRDRVFYNGGGGNPQEYQSGGAALTLTYDFGAAKLTAISGYESLKGLSRGDIDGGVAGVGPGFIPFDSDTQDAIDALHQFTQEVRLASPDEGPLTWQMGAYYFDSGLKITSSGPGTAGAATVRHDNQSWAVFGQGAYDLTDALKLTAGVRYTDDDKDFAMLANANPFVTATPASVSASNTSWDVSLAYQATPDLNLYGRVATGFRAPSIQGRDVAFQFVFAPPGVTNPYSIAKSETALAYEVGFKSEVLDRTGRINGAAFYYTIDDMQLTAIGGASNSNRLININEGIGYGFDLDAEFNVTPNFLLTTSFNYTHTEINDAALAIAPGGGGPTVLDPLTPGGLALIDGNPFPQAPDFTLSLTARYGVPVGEGGELFAYTDWNVRGDVNLFLYDSAEFHTDTQVEGGLKIGYARLDGAYEIAVFARNITDEENVIGGIDFDNLTGFVNEPRIVGVSLTAKLR
ncbi:MAG: TonB-dependent receptor [Hyphomonadaceae bacterium]